MLWELRQCRLKQMYAKIKRVWREIHHLQIHIIMPVGIRRLVVIRVHETGIVPIVVPLRMLQILIARESHRRW